LAGAGAGTLPVVSGAPPSMAPIGSALCGGVSGGRGGRRSSVSNCVDLIGSSLRWRSARPWMRDGDSSLAHSARSAAMALCSLRTSPCSLATRSAWSVESNLIF